MNREIDLSFLGIALALAAALQVVFVMLGVKATAFPLFLLLLLISVFLPGYELLHWFKLELSPFQRFGLAWIVGYPLSTSLYFICRYLQVEWFYGVILLGIILSFALTSWPQFVTPRLRWRENGYYHAWLVGLYLLILLVCGLASFGNGMVEADKTFRLTSLYPIDFMYHVNLTNELSHFFPPRIPFAPSFPMIYHFFPDLFAALFMRVLGLSVWDLLGNFLPLFYFSILFFSIILFTRELNCKKTTVIAALLILLLGSNLAFFTDLFGFINRTTGTVLEFQFVPTFMMLHINPMVIGLALLFGGCFTLSRYQVEKRNGWLLLCALLFISTVVFKIFVTVLLVGGLGLLALIEWIRSKQLPYSILVIMLPLALTIFFVVSLSPARGESTLKFFPGYLSVRTLVNSGIFPSTTKGIEALQNASNNSDYPYLFKFGLLGGIFWFFGSFGPRLIGLYFSRKHLFAHLRAGWPLSLLSWMCWLGIVLGIFFVIPPEDVNINHFFMISLYLAAFFTALFIDTLPKEKWRLLSLAVVLFFALPTSVAMLVRRPLGYLPPLLTEAALFLREKTEPHDVIAYPFDNPLYAPLMTLSGRRAMYLRYFMIHNRVGIAAERELAKESLTLYRSQNVERLKSIVKRYQVSYILEDDAQQTRLPPSVAETVYQNQGITIKKVVPLTPEKTN